MATIDFYQQEWWRVQGILDQGGLTPAQIAGYKAQQDEYHRLAEQIRAFEGGYSGGPAGDQIIVLADDPNTPWNEEQRFKETFSDQALTTDAYKGIIDRIESTVSNIASAGGLPEVGTSVSGIADIAITAVIGLFLFRLLKGVFK